MKTPHSEGTVLITGATSGIGLSLTKLFAKNNYDLVLVARNKEQLTALSNDLQSQHEVFIKILAKDLSDPISPDEIYDALQKDSITIDILVNNAGFATHGNFSEIPMEEDVSQVNLNIMALTKLTKLFLPHMIKQKSGKILNTASTAAFLPEPYMAVYYASKAYVLSLSEALAEELSGSGVTVTALCPGPTKTNFSNRADMQHTLLFKMPRMTADQVAQIGYDALMKGQRSVVAGKQNLAQSIALRFVPRMLAAKIAKRVNK